MQADARHFYCEAALIAGAFVSQVRIVEAAGRIVRIETGHPAQANDLRLHVVVPGFANAHSHAFHRGLRGRTHDEGGDFWRWRLRMYETATGLTPESYRDIAEQVFLEMRDAGYTAVGEFHYVHHRPDGRPYTHHDMELALTEAAHSAGLRLVLLDACYLRGGKDRPLSKEQRRFSDGSAVRWLERWHELSSVIESYGSPFVSLGAAIHSVRAVSARDLSEIAAGLPGNVPLHAHVSEQVAENDACLLEYGLTPIELLAEHGLVNSRFSAVHATHLSEHDIQLLGAAAANIVMCPTTEADLGDGVGPALELLHAGAELSVGSDQHVVIDPWEELTRLEFDQRLRLQQRGLFSLDTLWAAGSHGGYSSLGLRSQWNRVPGFEVGGLFDAVEIDPESRRLRGAEPMQFPLVARSSDVTATIVGGNLTRPEPRPSSRRGPVG